MKRLATTLGTLALALSLGVPAFAAKAPTAPKPKGQTQTATAKPQAKRQAVSKKSRKSAHKTAKARVKPASAKLTTPQQK
jgi:predicted lipid-binding transport protein (Tim44 family)